ncbi:hypothetical protein ABVK25_011281 [Lepraria finkii]|uniref:Uncharacterized protein n=1 Tax=Lepraria finkii TaxID=1340010 RepID=A0ABR4ASK4_9LECA
MAIPVGTQGAPGYKGYVVEVLGAIPSSVRNITVALPLIASFPAAQSPTPVPGGKRREITFTVPGTNVSLIATLGTRQDASPIPVTAYEYTVSFMRYYISAKLNTTGDIPLDSIQDPFFWGIGYGAWL